jgi:hypothetical protein
MSLSSETNMDLVVVLSVTVSTGSGVDGAA